MQIHAPAKINLFLAVRGTRPDGYRELETVIQVDGIPADRQEIVAASLARDFNAVAYLIEVKK